MLYYWSKLYSSEIGEGEEYRKLKKTISVLIADFELDILKDSAKCHTKWEIREAEYGKIVLTEVFELHIIELPKTVYTVKENLEENLLMWLKFIKNPEMLEEADMVKNKLLEKAKKEYEKFNKDEYEVRLAEAREKQLKDMNSKYSDGVEDGIEQGKIEKTIETAKKLLEMKFDIKTIMEITGLNKEEIENIK